MLGVLLRIEVSLSRKDLIDSPGSVFPVLEHLNALNLALELF